MPFKPNNHNGTSRKKKVQLLRKTILVLSNLTDMNKLSTQMTLLKSNTPCMLTHAWSLQ